MANPAPIGSDVSAGTGAPSEWETVTGADSRDDPYPES
jgi:hypothetical protein